MPTLNPDLTTLDHARRIIGLGISQTDNDALLRMYITQASSLIQNWICKRQFVPYVETRKYSSRGEHIKYDLSLMLDADLLEIHTLTNGSTTYTAGDYYLVPTNSYPKRFIELAWDGNYAWSNSAAIQEAVSVTGVWGYHPDWLNAWGESGDSIQDVGGISASVTTITVADADGLDDRGLPRFSVGDWLRLGTGATAEYLYVTAVNTAANTLTVKRGQRGTTAALRAKDVEIDVYRQTPDIQLAADKLVLWAYQNRDAVSDMMQVITDKVELKTDAVRVALEMLAPYTGVNYMAV